MVIEMCKSYTTTGYPLFKPKCKQSYRAGLKCHVVYKSCPGYEPSSPSVAESDVGNFTRDFSQLKMRF